MNEAKWILIALIATLTVMPLIASDDEEYPSPADAPYVEFTNGYQGSTFDDELFRVAEYDVVEPNAISGLAWGTSPYATNLLDFRFNHLNNEQLSGALNFDLDRRVQFDGSVDSLLHRLDHDPVSNLQAVSDIKTTRSTDLEVGTDYQIRYRNYDAQVQLLSPGIPGLSIHAGFRSQQRQGMRQALTTSHCTSCHTIAQGREIDHSITDYSIGAHYAVGRTDIDYRFLGRTADENGTTPTADYERGYRPAGPPSGDPNVLVLPFNDRLWYQDGEFPYNQVPTVKRLEHRLKFLKGVRENDLINVTLVQSQTENRNTGLQYDFGGFRGRYVWRPKERMRVNFYAHRDDIDNDTIDVDLVALNGLTAAPITSYPGNPGVTFEQWRQIVDDPTLQFNSLRRLSAYSRTDDRLGVDFTMRRKSNNTFRAGYRFRLVDRDYVTLADGTGETTSHRVKLGWNQRFEKKLRWNNSATYTQADNPYVNVRAAARMFAGFADAPTNSIVIGQASSPKMPESLQYYQLHALRMANLSNAATDDLRLRTQATWTPKPRLALSGVARYRSAENDELNFSDWEKETVGVGVNLWVAAGNKFNFTLGFDSESQETDAFIAIPLMDG